MPQPWSCSAFALQRAHPVESYIFPTSTIHTIHHPTTKRGKGINPQKNSHAAIKVHSVNANRRIILDAQIDMLANAEPKIPRCGEILLFQFVLFYFEAALKDFFGFGPAHGDVDGDFFVAANAEGADGVAGFAYGERETD